MESGTQITKMEKLDFEDLLRRWIVAMDDYDYDKLIQRLELYRAEEYHEDSARIQQSRDDIRETLYHLMARADGAAILAPWQEEQPGLYALTCSEWLEKAELY